MASKNYSIKTFRDRNMYQCIWNGILQFSTKVKPTVPEKKLLKLYNPDHKDIIIKHHEIFIFHIWLSMNAVENS